MVAEPIVGRDSATGWTISWKGRGWWQTFDEYLEASSAWPRNLARSPVDADRPVESSITFPRPDEEHLGASRSTPRRRLPCSMPMSAPTALTSSLWKRTFPPRWPALTAPAAAQDPRVAARSSLPDPGRGSPPGGGQGRPGSCSMPSMTTGVPAHDARGRCTTLERHAPDFLVYANRLCLRSRSGLRGAARDRLRRAALDPGATMQPSASLHAAWPGSRASGYDPRGPSGTGARPAGDISSGRMAVDIRGARGLHEFPVAHVLSAPHMERPTQWPGDEARSGRCTCSISTPTMALWSGSCTARRRAAWSRRSREPIRLLRPGGPGSPAQRLGHGRRSRRPARVLRALQAWDARGKTTPSIPAA